MGLPIVGELAVAAQRAALVVEALLDVAHRGEVLLELLLVLLPRRGVSVGVLPSDSVENRVAANAQLLDPERICPSFEKTRLNMLYGLVSLAIGWSEPA